MLSSTKHTHTHAHAHEHTHIIEVTAAADSAATDGNYVINRDVTYTVSL